MVRRVIRIAIVAWLVGAGIQWARRQGRSLGPLDGLLQGGRRQPSGGPRGGDARERLRRSASLEAASAAGVAADRAAEVAPPSPGDDLKVIEGIGPRFDELLRGAGIDSFARIASMTPDAIEQTIRDAGGRAVSAATWPDQARLAAAGQWDALAEMQSRLKGGREVEPPD